MATNLSWELCRTFLSVLTEGSLSGGARALGITQPTAGRHVAALEAAFGQTLFTRSQSGLLPTDAALELRSYALALQSTAAALERAAASLAELAHHTLIGFDQATPFVREAGKALPVWKREAFALRTDSDLAQLALIRAGCGIGVCQAGIARRDGLVRVLTDAVALTLPTWVVMHEDLRGDVYQDGLGVVENERRALRSRRPHRQTRFAPALVQRFCFLTGARRRLAHDAGLRAGQIVLVRDELAFAAAALMQFEDAAVEEAHERPSASQIQMHVETGIRAVFAVETISLRQRVDMRATRFLLQERVRVIEERRVNVGLPRHIPVGGRGQHALRRRFGFDFAVQANEAFARERQLRLEHLHAGTQLDQRDGA